jgi:hypothetical protein
MVERLEYLLVWLYFPFGRFSSRVTEIPQEMLLSFVPWEMPPVMDFPVVPRVECPFVPRKMLLSFVPQEMPWVMPWVMNIPFVPCVECPLFLVSQEMLLFFVPC